MAAATEVVARFTADISDVQSKMAMARSAFGAVGEAATFSSQRIAAVGQAMSDVGKKMTVGITLPLGGVAIAASNAAMSFETSMNKMIGLVGIATDEVARMNGEVLGMASAVGKAPDELAAGLFVVTSAGLRGSEAMSALGQSAKASAAGLGQTNDIARAVAGALSAYGSEVLSASDATDAIVATARSGNFETSQFAAAIGRVLPFAQQAGASFQEMGGAVALLTRVNGDAAQSVTQIQALFRAFVVPTEEAKTALEEMGLSAQDLRDSIAKKGLPATLQMLDRALGGNREQLGRILGSSEAASAAFQILESDAQTLQETFGVVRNSAGMTAEAFGAVSQTTQFQVNQAMTELKATLIDLGQQFLPIIKSVMDFMQAHLKAFNSLPGPVKSTITVMAGLLAAIGPLLFIVGKLIIVFSGLLSLMLKTRAVGAMRAAFVGLRGDLAAARASMKQTQTSIGMLGTAAQTAKIAVVSSFKAIGAAAKGLLASLGPIGLAMIAVGAAFEIFIGKAAGTEHHLSNLRDEIDLTTGKMTEAARLFIASELRTNISPEDLAMMESYGISISGFIAALEQGGPALDGYREKIKAMQQAQSEAGGVFGTGFANVGTINSINTIVENLDGMIGYYDAAKLAAQDAAAAQVDSAVAASEGARNMANVYRETAQNKRAADAAMTDSQKALDSALNAGVKAVEALQAAFEAMNAAIANEASRDSAIQGVKDLNAALESNGSAIKGTSDAAMANRAAIRDAAQQWIDYAAATKDPEQAQKRLAKGQDEIRAALKKAGIKPEQSDIFKVFKKQQSESKKTVDEFAAQREIASQYGNEVGMNFIDGIIAELKRRKAEVAAAAADVTAGLTTGGNEGIDADSPSKDAMKVAGNFIDGLVIGLRNRANDVRTAVSEAVGGAVPRAREEGSKLAKGLADAFAQALRGEAGSFSSAINEIFGSIPTQNPLEELLGGEGAAKFVENNQKALIALSQLGAAIDAIVAKVQSAGAAMSSLSDMVATPFGQISDLFQSFAAGSSIDSVISEYERLIEVLREAYSLLTDSSIVGPGAARQNQAILQGHIDYITELTAESVALREEYAANQAAIQALDDAYANQVNEINARYDAMVSGLQQALSRATEAYNKENQKLEELIRERDGFLQSISDGFRSFVNNLSFEARAAGKQVITETRKIAEGITVALSREIETEGTADIAGQLQERLTAIREFSTNIRSLMERGLDPTLIQDFVSAGVSGAGDAVKQLAAASQDQLNEINSVQRDLASETAGFQSWASAQYHDAAIDQQRAAVAAAEAQVAAGNAAIGAVQAARQKELDEAKKTYDEQKAALEKRNQEIEARMNEIALAIEARINEILGVLPEQSSKAGQDAIDKMIAGFRKRFPDAMKELGALMDQLVKSLRRTIRLDIKIGGGSQRAVDAANAAMGTGGIATGAATGVAQVLSPDSESVGGFIEMINASTEQMRVAWETGIAPLPVLTDDMLKKMLGESLANGTVLIQLFTDLAASIFESFRPLEGAMHELFYNMWMRALTVTDEVGGAMVQRAMDYFRAWAAIMAAMGIQVALPELPSMTRLNIPSKEAMFGQATRYEFAAVPVGMFAAAGQSGVTVGENAVNIEISVTGSPDDIERQVRSAVDNGFKLLAREVMAS